MTDCPCHGCDERISGETVEDCHADCERYLGWKAEVDRIRVAMQQEKVFGVPPRVWHKDRLSGKWRRDRT